jgi:rhodanese-related sulfurtransferase
MKIAFKSLCFIIVIVLFGTSLSFAQKFNTVQEMVDAAKKTVKTITVDDLKKKVEGGDSTLIIVDVREIMEFNTGKITNALNIPRGSLEFKLKPLVDSLRKRDLKKSDEIVLYCNQGDRSSLSAESLNKLGYTSVSVLQGGLDAWVKAGNKLDRSRYRPEALKGVNGPDGKTKEDIMKMREEMMKKRQQQQQQNDQKPPETNPK